MKLKYRGIEYQASTSSPLTNSSFVIGKYRGCTFFVKEIDKARISEARTPRQLKYRGNRYDFSELSLPKPAMS